MKFAIRTIIAALSLIATASMSFAAGPYGSISVGNWRGGAYTNDKTGAFANCAAGATYESGIYFMVSVNADLSWVLGFAQPDWHLNSGEAFPLALTFDGQSAVHVRGLPIGAHLVGVAMPTNSSLISQFRKAKTMTVFAQNHLFQFKLNQTAELLPSLVNCVVSIRKNGIAHATEFAVAKQPAPKSPAAAGGSAPSKTAKLGTKSGTGIVISSSGQVVTNQHVVSGCVGDILGRLGGEAPVKLRLVSSDETNDLALLQAPSPFKAVASIRSKPVRSGDSIIAIGYPFHGLLSSDFTVTTGIVSSLSGIMNDTRYLQISAAVQPGNSGGPLLDTAGQIAGVVAAKLDALKVVRATGDIPENINFAIKTGTLRDFLDNSAVDYQTADAKTELKTTDIAQNARAFTLLISCSAAEETASARRPD